MWNSARKEQEPSSPASPKPRRDDSSPEPYDERLHDSDHHGSSLLAPFDSGRDVSYETSTMIGSRRRRKRGSQSRWRSKREQHFGLDDDPGTVGNLDQHPNSPWRNSSLRARDRDQGEVGEMSRPPTPRRYRSPFRRGALGPEPTLRSVVYAIGLILRAYLNRCGRFLSKNGRRVTKSCCFIFGAIVLGVLILAGSVVHGFFAEVVPLCTPPADDTIVQRSPPLIEYYVHGRGNGHYARSVAIIESLNDVGVDIRMFIGRATMWRAVNEANPSSRERNGKSHDFRGETSMEANRGITTAISVTSIVPSMPFFTALSHTLERITGDCEVARQTGRYPDLVVSDGDMPGMFRARLGSIPSVGISHGQSFAISVKPDWIEKDYNLNKAWDRQKMVNIAATFFTSWQIGTGFVNMETHRETGVIAMSPLRPEVVAMAKARRWRHQKRGTGFAERSDFPGPAHQNAISSLLLGGTDHAPIRQRRKLVICYFRDKNGDVLLNALLRSGFDVLLFERGYHKGLMNIQGVEKFGHRWIVRRDDKSKQMDGPEVSRDEYWKSMLARTHTKVLGDELSDGSSDKAANKNLSELTHGRNTNFAHQERRRLEESELRQIQGHSDEFSAAPRIIRVTDMSLFVPLMSVADGVASSAGSQLLSECIYSSIPVFALYRESDSEQMLNIEMYRRMRGEAAEGYRATSSTSTSTHSSTVVHGVSVEEFTTAWVLRSPNAKRGHSEFNMFIDAVTRSTISQSYYNEISGGSTAVSSRGNARNKPSQAIDENFEHPFQGMPEAASVILEILKQTINE